MAGGDHRLDLVGVNVETRHDDHVLLAVDDLQESASGEYTDVTGLEVAARREGRGVCLVVVPIATHHLRTLGADLSRLTLGHLAAVIVDEFDVGRGDRQAAGFGELGYRRSE